MKKMQFSQTKRVITYNIIYSVLGGRKPYTLEFNSRYPYETSLASKRILCRKVAPRLFK